MDAMKYEYLIRMVFKCEKGENFGADADIFRKFELASNVLPIERAIDDYRLLEKRAKVTSNLQLALYEVKDQYKNNMEFTAKIDKCLNSLLEPSLDNIKKCIDEALNAFMEIGLKNE